MLTIRAVDSQDREQVAGPASQVPVSYAYKLRRYDLSGLLTIAQFGKDLEGRSSGFVPVAGEKVRAA